MLLTEEILPFFIFAIFLENIFLRTRLKYVLKIGHLFNESIYRLKKIVWQQHCINPHTLHHVREKVIRDGCSYRYMLQLKVSYRGWFCSHLWTSLVIPWLLQSGRYGEEIQIIVSYLNMSRSEYREIYPTNQLSGYFGQ